ncbi:MAG TPA: PilC/PilY family type IV pilus protein [Steroidobacteraceae bacterium]|nr:PilC/PilY family type IV pilus protein [Steroidobacteraceae bacterium]
MNAKFKLYGMLALAALAPLAARAQSSSYAENFTGATTNNSWYFSNGACLTAGSGAGTASPGQLPSCVSLTAAGKYYAGDTLVGGNTGTLPDSLAIGGALRFTNNNYNQHGAIISNFSFPLSSQGLKVTFTTETYEGDSGGSGGDGADGISFFLQDASQIDMTNPVAASATGDFGGSLAYTCSNVNNDPTNGYDGVVGGYVGLGIDEYGNFLNPGDNTATGPGYQWNRIGLRGAGSTAWSYLAAHYPGQYPATLTSSQQRGAVQNSCRTGYVWDYGDNPTSPTETSTKLPDYAAIPGAYKVLRGVQIANESARYRGYGPATTARLSRTAAAKYGVPITYSLVITPAGLLSLSYSYNGGAYQPVISGQDITASNGPIPANVRFGFAGSDGGSTNIHEIMCFQATPQNSAQSSAGLNQKQTAKVQTGTQVYFAFYNADNWTGSLTSQYLDTPTGSTNANALQIDPVVNWDASCVLTGVAAGKTCATTGAAGPIAAEGPTSRTILSWNGTQGIPFEWSNLTNAEQAALDTGDTSPINANRLNYLRGDRSNELTSTGSGSFRARTSVLGDIIDSSPTWVGAPAAPYPALWRDALNPSATPAENSGTAQSYTNFESAYQTRTNLVYAGANDGLLHAFRSGSFDSSGNYVATYNDGLEMLAFMPQYVVNSINASSYLTLDYSSPRYAHQFNVDAPPGVGDLFYGNQWHTWLVGGLGPGGSAIYALDITDPTQFSETNAANTVIGEWSTTSTTTAGVTTTTSTLNCTNVANCGNNLGNTYGVPQIRRFHNGDWGAVFGNGFGSATGDAGIYVMTVDPTTGARTFYYLSTGESGNGDGIAYVTPADLDGDHITDYVYAGDMLGNVWRFDLTGSNPSQWTVSPGPLYTTPAGQAITTKLVVASISAGASQRVLVEFGTGQQVPLTTLSAATYATSQQALYGVWDWNLAAWNAMSTVHYASLPSGSVAAPATPLSGLTSGSNSILEQQTITATYDPTLVASSSSTTPASAYYYRTVSSNPICWADTAGCTQFGWYLNLTSGYANPTDPNGLTTTSNATYPYVYEQVIFNPILESGAFIVNTTIPPTSSANTCAATPAGGWTMAINPATGGAFTNSFFGDANHNFLNVNNQAVSGIALSGTGSPSIVTKGTSTYIVTQTVSGTGAIAAINPPGGTQGQRLTWIQKR